MMVVADLESRASLAEILSSRAMSTPPSRLLIDLFGGAVLAGVAAWARPFAWFPLAAAATCLFAYGAWAMAEQRLESPDPLSERMALLLEAAQRITALLGIVAFLALLFGLVGVAFGRVIS
jgi:hypothetical protein